MDRLQFFRNLALSVVAVPAALVASDRQKAPTRMTARHVADIPPEAGSVNHMAIFHDHVFVGCANGLYTIRLEK